MPDNFYRHFETNCSKLLRQNKTPLCMQWLGKPSIVMPFDNEKLRIGANLGFAHKA